MKLQMWTPPKDWQGQEAFLIGGGPSLKGFEFDLLRGLNVIGCNDAFHLGPEINSYVCFGDAPWWHKNKWKLEQYKGWLVTNAPSILHLHIPNCRMMRRLRDGIHSGETLGWNYSTGALAINLAISLGATKIHLLGYDVTGNGTQSHWHKHNTKAIAQFAYDRFLRGFEAVKRSLPAGVEVINVTDGTSRLNSFPRMPIQDLVASLRGNKPKHTSFDAAGPGRAAEEAGVLAEVTA